MPWKSTHATAKTKLRPRSFFHRHFFRPQCEGLEDRTLMTATPVVPNAYMLRLMEQATLQAIQVNDPVLKGGATQLRTMPTIYTGTWVVGVRDASELQTVAGALDAQVQGVTPYLNNAFVYQFSSVDAAVANARLVTQRQLGNVSYFYPLLAKRLDAEFDPNDVLFPLQWHHRNTGQQGGANGEDARTPGAWNLSLGAGVQIAILDEGMQYDHPDLAPNAWTNPNETLNGLDDDGNGFVDDVRGWDWNDVDNDPYPEDFEAHGTAVGGIAAARGDNGIGVSGAAPMAQLTSLRILGGFLTDNDIAQAESYQNQIIDIYNNSWGVNGTNQYIIVDPVVELAYEDTATNGRGGLGGIIVRSAGNNFDAGAVPDDVNYNAYRNSRFAIAVAAVDGFGVHSFYSNPGAPIIVSAPSSGNIEGTVTTDRSGDLGYNGLPDLEYTNGFGGTSSAAPLVSGVVGLMLAVNPNLTYRDVQEILARTARQNNPSDPGWVQNGAGLWVNHLYGYGVVDATAAVTAAATWEAGRPEFAITSGTQTPNLAIPDDNAAGLSLTATMPNTVEVEWVELEVDISHTYIGDLNIELISPDGTRSVLAQQRFEEFNADLVWKFTSYRHLGEQSGGDWTIHISDTAAIDTGTLNSFKLNVYGKRLQAVGVDDTYTIAEDGQLFVPSPGVLVNDSGGVTARRLTNPQNGTLFFNANGSFRYIPRANFNGTDSFTYVPNNGDEDGTPATVTINVTPVNDAPVANPDGRPPLGGTLYVVRPGGTLAVSAAQGVLANDTDVEVPSEGQTLSAILAAAPLKSSSFSLNPNGSFSYTAKPATTGDDQFFYAASDGQAASATVRVLVHINTPTLAQNEQFATYVGNPLALTGNVLANDIDNDITGNVKDTLTAILVSFDASKGAVTLGPDGTFSFTPTAAFTSGTTTFTYKVFDGWEEGNIATVTLFMDRLPAAQDNAYTVRAGGSLEVFAPGLLGNDSDADLPLPAGAPFFQYLNVSAITQMPQHGTLVWGNNGYFRYTPAAGLNGGVDTFKYRLHDGLFAGGEGTVTITVQAVPVAVEDNYVTFTRQLTRGVAQGVLANDSSPNANFTTARLVSPAANGTLSLQPDGSFQYLAHEGFVGIDFFSYVASVPDPNNPGQSLESAPAQVSITVYAANGTPVARDDAYATAANTALTLAAPGLLGNDSDPDNDPLTAHLAGAPAFGTLVLNYNGSFTYTPQPGFQGTDSFSYQASDGQEYSATATVRITVGTPPPPPSSPSRRVVQAQEVGGTVRVFAGETGQAVLTLQPYGAGFSGGVRVAVGDLTGDGVADIVTAPGPHTGTPQRVRVFNGVTGQPLGNNLGTGLLPFGASYRGGVQVALGDVNGDGTADIVVSADVASTNPSVRVLNGTSGAALAGWLGGFRPYSGTGFGGVRVAVGDVNGDGRADIITSPGASTPQVKVYNAAAGTLATAVLRQFNAYSSAVAGGVFVAAGDLDGDGKAEIVTGAAANAQGHVRIFYGNPATPTRNLTLTGTGLSGPAKVALGDIDGNGRLDLVVGQAISGGSRARVYDAVTLTELFGADQFAFGGGYNKGLFVAALPKVGGIDS